MVLLWWDHRGLSLATGALGWQIDAAGLCMWGYFANFAMKAYDKSIGLGMILLAYYSRRGQNHVDGRIVDLAVGNTEWAMQRLEMMLGADMFRIDTVHPYPEDYTATVEQSHRELDAGARPELTARVQDMARYDVVILGYPNWCGTMPMAVFTFLESYDFTGKTLIPCCTHEGGGLGRSVDDIRALCPGAHVLEGVAIVGSHVRQAERELEHVAQLARVKSR